MAASASAATYNIIGSYSGGQLGDVKFDITIDADFTSDIFSTDAGLTINSLTSSVVDPFLIAGGLGYDFRASGGVLSIGGLKSGANAIVFNTDDFRFVIRSFPSAPIFFAVVDTRATTIGFASGLNAAVKVTDVSAVPLPAGGFLLLTGLLAAAGVGHRKKRAA